MRRIVATLLPALLLCAAPAQDRLFQPEDRKARSAVASELQDLLRADADLNTAIALAAVAGTGLPAGSTAAVALQEYLQAAHADGNAAAAARRLRSDLGDLIAVLTFEPLMEAEVPEGFPGVGVVGELEVRHYPAYRMAQTAMSRGSMSAFWPLFQHIQSNDIAMTTPVQMDWQADSAQPTRMAFLYGKPSIEPKSTAKNVEVVEVPAMTVLSLGAIGEDRRDRVEQMRQRLEQYLSQPTCPYEAAGPLRTMGYNSPMAERDRRYFEVQIPVRVRAF